MKYKCKFNPKCDIQATIPGLDTDLTMAIESGVVMNTGLNPTYNLIDDPANIRGKIGDVFDAINAQRAILNAGRITEPSTGTAQTSTISSPVTPSTLSEG